MEQEEAEEEAKRKALTAKVSRRSILSNSLSDDFPGLALVGVLILPPLRLGTLSCMQPRVCSPRLAAQVQSRHRIVTPGRRDASPYVGGGAGGDSSSSGAGGGGGLQVPKAKRRPTPRGI
jgi:hypothetical protein